jgi:hypothetical protein
MASKLTERFRGVLIGAVIALVLGGLIVTVVAAVLAELWVPTL